MRRVIAGKVKRVVTNKTAQFTRPEEEDEEQKLDAKQPKHDRGSDHSSDSKS